MISYYDLLGMIKDENIPKKIRRKGYNYEWDGQKYFNKCYLYSLKEVISYNDIFEKNIEIIEEDKDIEELDVALLSQSDNWLWCPSKHDFKEDLELNASIIENIRSNTLAFQRKINEVIREINKLRKEDK